MAFLLKKGDMPAYVSVLLKSYDIYAPVVRDDVRVYSQVKAYEDIDLEKNTLYPPKKLFFPPEEAIYSYSKKRGLLGRKKEIIEENMDYPKRIIFGMRMCDVSAIRKMDKFYTEDIQDPYYAKRRENTFIIALKCDTEENDDCFCSSFDIEDEGYDLYLEDR